MKKVLCVLLSIILILGISLCPVSAVPLDKYVVGTNNGYEICVINPYPNLPREVYENIGDYFFNCGAQPASLTDEGLTAIFAVKGEEILYIKTAYERGLIDLGAVAKMMDGYCCYMFDHTVVMSYDTYLIGDLNKNWQLEVADAVIIQKVIAKQAESPAFGICDMNKDGETNVEDVLLLQKKIAKIVA